MKHLPGSSTHVAIACGGTGGHLFPGLAVGRELGARGARVTLLISPKEVDQAAVQGLTGIQTATLPAVGLQGRNYGAFLMGFGRAWQAARRLFTDRSIALRPPDAILGMGGFTAAPPMLAGRHLGAATFLHESNTIPGRANRLMARWTQEAFTGFDETVARLGRARVTCTGTPVRDTIAQLRHHRDSQAAKACLGLDPAKPVLLITGGSQGSPGPQPMGLRHLARTGRHGARSPVHPPFRHSRPCDGSGRTPSARSTLRGATLPPGNAPRLGRC